MITFQKATQTATLFLFLALLLLAANPYYDNGLAVDFFLRLDPLVCLGTVLTTRSFEISLLPGFLVLAAAILAGRFFCGHICPMGTTLDLLQVCLGPSRKPSVKKNTYEATARYRAWKYLILVFVLGAALAGVSLLFIGSPLSLVTRFYGLVVHPLVLLLADSGLDLASSAPFRWAFPGLAYVQISGRAFATNVFVGALFVGIVALAYSQPRFWCRNLCPAGALMGLFSRSPILRRRVNDSCSHCGRCIRKCPTGAIFEDPRKTTYSECIVCLECVKICPESAVSFSAARNTPFSEPAHDPTRRSVVLALGSGLISAGLLHTGIKQPRPQSKERGLVDADLIRPPGALPESDFLTRCVRCGECMKACATNTLQPTWLKAGLEGIFTPIMIPRLAACSQTCNLCGQVCPTGAIRDLPLIEKKHAKVGTAWIVRQNCLVWEQDRKCLVCDEVCPYNAISFQPAPGLKNAAPVVIENKCSGCGLCENKCPVQGAAAIRVNIIGEIRLASGSYIEKAHEYGLSFRTKKTALDRLAPETFDQPGSSVEQERHPEPERAQPEELPPGFILK
ncbi:MAG: 4Fe-4S binding protein [Desulfomonilaceae bacterium]